MIGRYRKKPVIVEAVPLLLTTWHEICNFAGVGSLEDGKPQGCFLATYEKVEDQE